MESGLTSTAFTTAAGEVLKDIGVVGSVGLAWLFNPVPLGINNRIIRPEYISKEEAEYMKERYPEYYSSISQNRYFKVDETRSNLWSTEQKEKVDRGALHFYAEKNNKELETAREIGGAVGTVAVMGWNVAKYSSAEKLEFNSENYTGSSNNFNEKPPLGLIEIDGIYQVPEYPTVVLKSGGSLVPVTNTNTSLVPFNPNASTGMSVTNLSSAGIIGGIVVPNLITSGKSVTTLEAPKNPVIKPFIKPKQDIETVKQPSVTSEKPKTVERSHSQGSNNHNSNKESFNQKTEKILIEILLVKIMAQKKLQIKCHHFQIGKIFIEIVIPQTMTTRVKIVAVQIAQVMETVVLRKILSLLWRIVARFIH